MKLSINPKSNVPQFELEDKDIQDAQKIHAMMQTPGWKVLAQYMLVARESIIDSGKAGIVSRIKKDLSSEKWSILKGWDECSSMAQRIVARAEDHLEKQQKDKEEDNGNGLPEDGN